MIKPCTNIRLFDIITISKSKETIMKKLVLAAALIASTPAFAWGEREQGALAGVAGLWIFQQLSKPQVVVQQPPVIVQQPPVIVQQPPVIVQQPPVYSLPRSQHGGTPIYERRTQWDANCNCYIVVYNQIGWQ